MRTLAVIARKGGSGKTTLCVHLALAAHLRGRAVLLADTDVQRSSNQVLKGRKGDGPALVETSGPKLFALQLAALREGVNTLVIDTPAAIEEEISHAIVAADLCLLVIRSTFLDLAAAIQTAEIVRRLRKPALIVVNQAPVSRNGVEPPAVKRALEALLLMRLPVIPIILRARAGYQSALESGRSVEEIDPGSEATREISELWEFVETFVFGRESVQATR
ncbi:ParA family protein [Phenylobacterium sp.]|uniref:ParA family protein n=1 Tax=Phenylobacterium sp. TaxID=1871053 RepID=UPI00286B40DC|nr:ParA family protein [Phenylobacterium sp.]